MDVAVTFLQDSISAIMGIHSNGSIGNLEPQLKGGSDRQMKLFPRLVPYFLSLFALSYLSFSISEAELVGQWLFDAGKGDIAVDSSGNGNDGTINNAEWVEGKFREALEFTGSSSNVVIQHAPVLSVEEFTLMAWMNVPGFTGAWQTIVTQNTDGPTRNYGLFINDVSGLIHYSFTSGNAWQSFNAGTNVVDGQWHHICAAYDKRNFICYVDGEIDGQTPNTLEPDTANTIITIGSWVGGGWLKGSIDEVALFNHPLQQNEIKLIMEHGLESKAVEPQSKLTTTWGSLKNR
jgi:hypothetical protein